jgi:phosphate:Na+ symporter
LTKTSWNSPSKKIKHKYEFSKEGGRELEAFHKRIIDNLKLAFCVFINDNVKVARTLIGEKTQLRTAELACADSHLARLREGRPESIETSSLHLDVLRDLKRIHSHICSVAYPVLDAAGELHPNRLRDVVAGGNGTAASDAPQFPAQSS